MRLALMKFEALLIVPDSANWDAFDVDDPDAIEVGIAKATGGAQVAFIDWDLKEMELREKTP